MMPDLPAVNAATLAKILGVSRSTVANLATDGKLPRRVDRLFDVATCVQAYLLHRLEQARASGDGAAVQSLMGERARLARLKADQVERAARMEAGSVVEAADVERTWIALAMAVRTRLLLIPSKIASRVTGKPPAEVQSLLRAEIHAALAELAATTSI